MPQFHLILTLTLIGVAMFVILHTVAYLILLERWISAWVQKRLGPNRVGPWGLLQPIADGAKMFLKEDIIPDHVDKVFYVMAPVVACATALFAFAVVPFGPTVPLPGPQPTADGVIAAAQFFADDAGLTERTVIAPGIDIGILFCFAVGSMAVYGVILAGWSSNNKYSMLGALRSSAQLISYEIPLGLSILGVVMLSGSLNLERIIAAQVAHGWFIWYQPLAFFMFLTASYAECNRLPFDLPECEQELVGGYHTEYSSMKFGMFFLGEYTHMITTSFLVVILFLGGWHFPGLTGGVGVLGWAMKLAVFLAKVGFFLALYIIVRWTLPRFRFDQLMGLAWKAFIPLATLNLVAVMVVSEFELSWAWVLTPVSLALILAAGAVDLFNTGRKLNRLTVSSTRELAVYH